MDLPPSGWYPDPYGVPGLLRWWDGSAWTQHTHQDGGTDATDAAESAAPVQQTTVQPTVQPASVPPTTVQPTVQAGAQPTTYQPAVRPTTYQPSAQPATPQPTSLQPTTVQPTTVQPATAQPATPQPTSVQPTAVQPTTVQPGGALGAGPVGTPPQAPDANRTQVLFLGDDAWSTPGAPGDPGQRDPHGYYRARQRRRLWVMAGLAGGTAVALGLTALVVTTLGQSPDSQTVTQRPTRPAAATTPLSPSPTPSPTPSATSSGSLIDDGTSGLSYAELAAWQPNCPSGLNNSFAWDAGESAIAGQISGGQTTWYGVACSAPLPQSYGYTGVADLQNVATTLVNQFNGAYYSTLQHTFQQEVSQPLSISGHAGWEIKFLMSYTNAQSQGLPFTDEEGAVVVADLGSGIQPAVFYTSVPSNLQENNVNTLLSSLTLTVPAQPDDGGSPGDGSPAAGSPAAGSPNP